MIDAKVFAVSIVLIFESSAMRCADLATLWSEKGDGLVFVSPEILKEGSHQVPEPLRQQALSDFRRLANQSGCQPAFIGDLVGKADEQVPRTIPELVDLSPISFVGTVDRVELLWSVEERRIYSVLWLKVGESFRTGFAAGRKRELVPYLIGGGSIRVGQTQACTDGPSPGVPAKGARVFFAGLLYPQFAVQRYSSPLPFASGTLLRVEKDEIQLTFPFTNDGTMVFPLNQLRLRSGHALQDR